MHMYVPKQRGGSRGLHGEQSAQPDKLEKIQSQSSSPKVPAKELQAVMNSQQRKKRYVYFREIEVTQRKG